MVQLFPPRPSDPRTRRCRPQLLIVTQSPSDAADIIGALRRAGLDPEWNRVESESAFRAALETPPDLILADDRVPNFGGLCALELLRTRGLNIPTILVSSEPDDAMAVAALGQGAADYFGHDRLALLGPAVCRTLEHHRLREDYKWVQQKLRVAEDVSGHVAEHSLIGIQILVDGRYAYLNPRLAEIFGYTEKEMFALDPWTDLVAEQDRAMALEQTGRSLSGGTPRAPHVFRGIRKDQTAIDVELHSDVITLHGRPAVLGMLLDVTDRKPVQENLRLRDRAIQAERHGILITDPLQADNPIVFANRGFEQLTGYAATEVVGRNCRFLQGPESDPAAVERIREAIRHATPCTVELVNYRKNGTRFWNELSIAPVLNDAGRLTHFIGVQSDVTERRQLEERFRQAQKLEAFGKLAAGVAHDFNNLMTVILGCCEYLDQDDSLNVTSRMMTDAIRNAGGRGASLTRQLLAFSRLEIPQPKVQDLNEVTSRTVKMLDRLIGEDIVVTTLLSPTPGWTKVDAGQIEQVLINLALNARDAMPQGGTLILETSNADIDANEARKRPGLMPGSYVTLSVSDTGCGMDQSTVARAFEPFFTTKDQGQGTGLGLATVHGIVQESNGHISIESEPGAGTTITLYFPRNLPAAESEAQAQAQTQAEETPPRGSETVLLVEDSEPVRKAVSRSLQSSGYVVLEAASGREALRIFQDDAAGIHLVLTDVVMPEMSGRQLSEHLLAMRPHLKLLFMSGFTDDVVLRQGAPLERTSFIQKPFSTTALARKVRALLDSR